MDKNPYEPNHQYLIDNREKNFKNLKTFTEFSNDIEILSK